jgi:predicted Zn-dependent peptidase
VKNEVRVNVLNAPYGGFPWLDLPQVAYENWYNAHNFYGEFGDLDAATLEELQAFFETFYAPNNAALVVVGDIDLDQTRAWIEKYFAAIEPSPLPPRPDISEPRQEREKRVVKRYPRAPRPGVAVGFHAPDREAPEYVALGVIDQVLGQGRDSRLYQRIVQEKGLAGDVSAYLNPFGHMFNVEGPALYTIEVLHDEQTTPDAILEVIDEEIARLQREPVDRPTLERALTKAKSSFYDTLESDANFGRADLLGSFALFFDDPARINTALDAFAAVTPELIQRTAREYLRPTNRTVLVAEPGPES